MPVNIPRFLTIVLGFDRKTHKYALIDQVSYFIKVYSVSVCVCVLVLCVKFTSAVYYGGMSWIYL